MPEKLTPSDRRTTAAEYLDRAKTAMGVASDYALAKRLEVDAALIAHLRRGRRTMPLILAVKIAITLEADPLAVIAEMQLERAKNPAHREFWRSFPRRAGMAAVTACTRAFGCFGFCVSGAGRAGGLTAGSCPSYFA